MTINRRTSQRSRVAQHATSPVTEQATTTVASSARRTSHVEDRWAVFSTWSGQAAVSDTELNVIELYLCEFIDQLVGARKPSKSGAQPRGPP